MAHTKSEAVPKRSRATLEAGISEGQLLGRFIADHGESAEAAFAILVRRHGPMVLRVCRQVLGDRHGAEDAFQATFLVLARKSSSIRQPELLANWLYGVALRTAREARMREGRRRQLETPTAELVHQEPSGDVGQPEATLICREELEALHEEVSRLPEKYRIPVVLCELQGLTYQEVASRMGCPASTIGVRLVRARERLRSRLVRRGIVPGAVLTEAVLGAKGASALLSTELVDSTAGAASVFAASDGAAIAFVSGAVVALTEAVLKTMSVAPLKATTSVILAVSLAAGIGWFGGLRPAWAPSSIEKNHPRPSGEAPSSAKPAPILAARPRPTARPNAPIAAAPILAVGSSEPDRPAGLEIVAALMRKVGKPNPLPALEFVQRQAREEQARGEALFFKEWVENDPASPHGDGLGPVYNDTSCVACHGLGSPGGAGPEGKNVVILTAIPTNGRPVSIRGLESVHPGFQGSRSTVLHRYGTDPTYALWRRQFFETGRMKTHVPQPEGGEETVETRIRRLADQTTPNRRVLERTTRLQTKSGITLRVSERNTPALFGSGQIDRISSSDIIDEARHQPAEVRGRVGRDRDGRVGRFGWKAQVASLHQFVRGACASELGLEVPGHSQPRSPLDPLDKAKGLDMSQSECDALVAYVRSLPAPVVVDPDGPQGTQEMREGRRIFGEIGCASCHAPSLGEVRGIYSDLLLHDLGETLGDSGRSYGIESPESPGGPIAVEWRTPPLWGFRDSGPYLHDGRAETLEEAVALHGGQGAASARRFFELASEEQSSVETFLKSLIAPSTAAAGVMLASELEAQIEPDEVRQAEALVRKQKEEADALEVAKQAEARRRELLASAMRRAPGQFLMAVNLEKAGKIAGALEFYRTIVREARDSEEGRASVARIADLLKNPKAP
jgi:RNA polymerase sigma factor (sigma-70 family)